MRKIAIILLIVTKISFGQDFKTGLLIPDLKIVDESEICCIYIPKDGFNVYSSPNGEIIGKLSRLNNSLEDEQELYKLYFIEKNTKKQELLNLSDFQEIGYEIWALKYIDSKNNFIKVELKNQNFWINKDEILRKGFKVVNWQTFLLENADNLLGYYANDKGLNLREEPNDNSKIIATVKGDLFEIKPTPENVNIWTKVKIRKYKKHPCLSDLDETELIEYELEGWLKLVDENGFPNVWYYARGC